MSFRKILLGLMTILLGLVGVMFGGLFLLGLGLYLLWHGLSLGIAFFGLVCLMCLVLAGMALRRATAKERPQISSSESARLPEFEWPDFAERVPSNRKYDLNQHKIQ